MWFDHILISYLVPEKTRMEQELLADPKEAKAVCKKHERAYVVRIGCPYCEEVSCT